jgi:two-component system, NarL family, sensor histidine kinase DesK
MSDQPTVRTPWSPFLQAPSMSPQAGRRWRLFAGVWLVFLLQPLGSVLQRTSGWRTVAGVLAILAFAALYAFLLPKGFRDRHPTLRRSTPWLLFALALAVLPLAGESGLTCFVFVAVAFLATYPPAVSFSMLGVLLALAGTLPYLVPGWSRDGFSQVFQIGLAAVVVLAMFQLLRAVRALQEARQELADLAVVEERERFARDLHDVLGHSLTVITKKAELAARLAEVDPARAGREIADVERLARQALQDVRSTVTGYRSASLVGELVSAREALQVAGVRVEVHGSADDVEGPARELFAWAIRESVTNVLRHSGASTCRITLSPTAVEIRDNGGGAVVNPGEAGNGLVGLGERVDEAGGSLHAESPPGGGFVVRVELPVPARALEATA